MTPRTRKSGPILFALVCGAMAGLGLLVGLLLGQRISRGTLESEFEARAATAEARIETASEDLSRARLELADVKDAAMKAEGLLAESRAEAAALRADLERAGAERDEHLAARIALERKLDDALELLATRGD